MKVADQEYVELLRLAAGTLTGHKRRVFVAEVTIRLCDGNAQQAEERFGWGRQTQQLDILLISDTHRTALAELLSRGVSEVLLFDESSGADPGNAGRLAGSAEVVSGLLFLPVGWWHYVKGLSISMTVTFTNFVFANDFSSSDTTFEML